MSSAAVQCPDANVLASFVAGLLPDEAAGRLEAHAAQCADCRELLAVLARTSAVEGRAPSGASAEHATTEPYPSPGGREEPDVLAPGSRVGRYVVLDRLGIGGMGVVYAAHDPELGRGVALKLTRSDLLSAAGAQPLQDRLLREAQSMARLTHPNVVSVHDVGRVGDQIFLAMELVEGQTVRAWLRETRRSWRQVVAVFAGAGRGLLAAHAAGILHRDFKPDNVLIGRDGRARVTDFGVARLLLASPVDAPARIEPSSADSVTSPLDRALTGTGALLGTPLYMAPEQLLGDPVDERTDQFSFCVALWEALHGERPFAGGTIMELVASIAGGALPEPPRASGVPRWLRRVVARGLAARPDDRFPSMGELLGALEAAPRRRRRRVIAAASALVLGGAGLVGYAMAGPEPELCTGAERSFDGVWDAARRESVRRSFLATGVGYAPSAFAAVATRLDHHRDRWIALQTEACRATRVRGDQPEDLFRLKTICLESRRKEVRALVDLFSSADAALVETAAQAAYRLSDLNRCDDVEALSAPVPPPTDARTATEVDRIDTRVAEARARRDAGKLADALELARSASAAAGPLGYRPLEAEALQLQASIERRMGDKKAAEKSYYAALHAAEAGRHDVMEAMAWTGLVFVIGYDGAEYARGMELARHASAVLERLGGDAEVQATLEQALGAIEGDQGHLDPAVEHFERAARLLRSRLGDDHQSTIGALDNLALTYASQGRLDRAIALHRQVLAIRRRTLGDDHPVVAQSLEYLGNALHSQRNYVEAERYLRQAVALRERTLPADHPDLATSLINLANALSGQGRHAEALELGRRSLAIGERAFGPDHPTLARLLINVGYVLSRLHRQDEALAHFRRAAAMLTRALGPEAADVAGAWTAMGDSLADARRWREALPLYQRAAGTLQKALGPDHPDVAAAVAGQGSCYLGLGQAARAIAPLERAVAVPEDRAAPQMLAVWRFNLARALQETGRDRSRAIALARSARAALAAAGPGSAEELARVDAWLAAGAATSRSAGP